MGLLAKHVCAPSKARSDDLFDRLLVGASQNGFEGRHGKAVLEVGHQDPDALWYRKGTTWSVDQDGGTSEVAQGTWTFIFGNK